MFVIQLAKQHGARVIATASARNREFVLSLGADDVIDYRASRFEDCVKDLDVVSTPSVETRWIARGRF